MMHTMNEEKINPSGVSDPSDDDKMGVHRKTNTYIELSMAL